MTSAPDYRWRDAFTKAYRAAGGWVIAVEDGPLHARVRVLISRFGGMRRELQLYTTKPGEPTAAAVDLLARWITEADEGLAHGFGFGLAGRARAKDGRCLWRYLERLAADETSADLAGLLGAAVPEPVTRIVGPEPLAHCVDCGAEVSDPHMGGPVRRCFQCVRKVSAAEVLANQEAARGAS